MAGLLDDFSEFIKTPGGQGLLSAAFGGLASARADQPWNNLGRAGMSGLAGYGNAQDRDLHASQVAQQKKMQDQSFAHQQMQMEAAKREAERKANIDAGMGKFFTPAQEARPAYTPIDGMLPPEFRTGLVPMAAQPAKPAGFDAAGAAQFLAQNGEYGQALPLLNSLAPKERTLSPGQVVYSGDKKIFEVPKEVAMPSAVQEYNFAKGQGYPGTFEQWSTSQKKAGASKVEVPINLGQKGLDNTLKVRGDFRSEPIYKAHGEVQSAHSQISTSLKQNSPAGDLAGATKLMKILDPGSVVRESELGMAMAASGLLDRVQNYGSMVMSGQKLTPTQRKDFQALSDALLKESQGQYSAKREEYKGIAERNQLSVPDILGPEPKVEQKAVENPQAPKIMDALPTANKSNRGQRMRDTVTGKVMVSNGIQWKPE